MQLESSGEIGFFEFNSSCVLETQAHYSFLHEIFNFGRFIHERKQKTIKTENKTFCFFFKLPFYRSLCNRKIRTKSLFVEGIEPGALVFNALLLRLLTEFKKPVTTSVDVVDRARIGKAEKNVYILC